ncbi:MAG TPA: hypothetical protein VF322_04740 [Gammaproteobacteria bacterium]
MSNGFDLTQHINLRDPELLDTFRAILERREQGSLKPAGAENKTKERIGERQALDRLSRRFPGAEPIVIARRPNGVPVLDLVLKTSDGHFVIIESKFSATGRVKLGRTISRMWVSTRRGWKAIKVRGATTQMSPRWLEDRLAELVRYGQRRLAGELNQALRAGRFNAYTVLTDSTGEVLKVIDHTPEWARSYTRPDVELTPASPIPDPAVAPTSVVGNRAVENRLTAGPVVEEGEALLARRSATAGAREVTEVLARRAAVRGAARIVGRVLVAVLGRVLMVLNAVGLVLLAVEVVSMIWDHFKNKAINAAIDKALRTNIPVEIDAALKKHEHDIARYYARAWLNKGNESALFLYLSPRMFVEGGYGQNGFEFAANVRVRSIERDLVSTEFFAPNRKEIMSSGPSYYNFEIRWSVAHPIYTPFDIYLAFTEFFVEHVVDSWAMQYATGAELSTATVKLFYSAVDLLAELSATLKYEPWFGYEPGRGFSTSRAAGERWEALQKLSKRIEEELAPKISELESRKLVNPHTARWDAFWSPLRSELDPREEDSLLPALHQIAVEMKYLDAAHLEYERFETLHARSQGERSVLPVLLRNSIESQKMLDLREFLRPVQHHLPKSLSPGPELFVFPAETAGKLVLERTAP